MLDQLEEKPLRQSAREASPSSRFSIELRLPVHENTRVLAKQLTNVFNSCGFRCESVRTLSAPVKGVQIQSHPSLKGPAQLISAAFDTASIPTNTAWNPALEKDLVVITVGHSQAF